MAVMGDTMLPGQLCLRYVDKNRDQDKLSWQMQQGWRLKLKGQQAPRGQGAVLKWPYVPAPRRAGPVNVLSEISGSEAGEGRMAVEGGLGPGVETQFSSLACRVPAGYRGGARSLDRKKMWMINLSCPRTGTGSDSLCAPGPSGGARRKLPAIVLSK